MDYERQEAEIRERSRQRSVEDATVAAAAWLRRIFWLLFLVWVAAPAALAALWMLR